MELKNAKFMVLNELHPDRHRLLKLPKNVKMTSPNPEKVAHNYTRALAILHADDEWKLVSGRGITMLLFPGSK